MQQHLYVNEKLNELEKQRRALPSLPPEGDRRRPVVGPAARAVGRRVRRLGEALESWGAPARARDACS